LTAEETADGSQQRAQESAQRAQEIQQQLARYRDRFGELPE
jgi:hypothetical protein